MGFQKNNTRSRFEKINFLDRRFSQTVALIRREGAIWSEKKQVALFRAFLGRRLRI
jgi:hypothetical protein